MSPTAVHRQRHLRVQVQVGICLLILACGAGIGEWLARETAATDRARAGEHLLETARDMADRLSQEMAARARDVQALADTPALRHQPTDTAEARDTLAALQKRNPRFTWMGLTDRDGTVVAATGDLLVGQSIAARPVFQNGLKGLWTGDVHEAVLLAKLVPHPQGEDIKFVDVAMPVRGTDGEPAGVLAAHLSWQWAEELRETVLRPRGAPATLQLMIAGAKGDILLPPERGATGAALTPARVTANTDRWTDEPWNDQRPSISAVAESMPLGGFRGFGWKVVVRDTAAAEQTSVESARPEAYAWSLGVAAALALLAGWAVARLWPKPRRREPMTTRPATLPPGAVRPQRRSDLQSTPRASAPAPLPAGDNNHRDPLTGLGNGIQLAEVGRRLAAEASAEPAEVCVLSIDLHGFQGVNDRYGRAAGDEVLVQIARRLRQAAREGDSVFRLGADDFVVLLSCPAGEGAALARAVAARVLTELQRPLSYRTLSNLRVQGSVGGAVWPAHGATLEEAVARAGEALLAARSSGPGKFRLYAGAQGASPDRLSA